MPLCVTLGDPAGIGPEVVEAAARLFLAEEPSAHLVVVGPAELTPALCARLGSRARPVSVSAYSGVIGVASSAGGRVSLEALMAGIELVKRREVKGLVTAPISKEALALAGSSDRGHTEILARELGGGPTAMAFFAPKLRVVLTSAHVSMLEAIASLSSARVVECARLLDATLRGQLQLARPRLALAALNPHASEHGLMGNEEARVLEPAVSLARSQGLHLDGPLPADSVFRRAMEGEFDGVVALYHDQALIPIKLLSFGEAVNVTLGLVAPRTSPDHGTAFDIAGRGVARPDGMLAALRAAWGLARSTRA